MMAEEKNEKYLLNWERLYLHFVVVSGVTTLGYFWKVVVTNFLTYVAQIFDNFLGYFEKWDFSRKFLWGYFGAILNEIGLLSIPEYGHTGCELITLPNGLCQFL